MWITAPLERDDNDKFWFVDREAINLYTNEAAARQSVEDELRSGAPLVGLFNCEGIYDADVIVRKLEK